MNSKLKDIILYSSLFIVGNYFMVMGLHRGKEFFIPLVISILLAMLMVPVERKMRQWGIPRGWAALFSDIIILVFCLGLFFIAWMQVKNFANDWPKLQEKIKPGIENVQNFIEEKTGISPQVQQQKITKYIGLDSLGGSDSKEPAIIKSLFSFSAKFLLVFVYIFFFLFFKDKFRTSTLIFFSRQKRNKVAQIIDKISHISQRYLFGKLILIIFLAIIYSIGLTIVGLKHAIFISIIASILTLIPYLGNIIGALIAVVMAVLTGDGWEPVIGVIVVFSITQFFETYFMEPFIIGHKIDLNPVLTIIGIVAGGAIWNIAGMILAMPTLGILKVIFDNIPTMQPIGYLLGEEGIPKGSNWYKDFEDWIKRKIKK
ncbi:MAG: AI-2E family transporter [bacterium]